MRVWSIYDIDPLTPAYAGKPIRTITATSCCTFNPRMKGKLCLKSYRISTTYALPILLPTFTEPCLTANESRAPDAKYWKLLDMSLTV